MNSVRLLGFHKGQRGVLASRGKDSGTERHSFTTKRPSREFGSTITGGAPTSCTLQKAALQLQDTHVALFHSENDWRVFVF